jgi:hypothetical protein
MSHFLLYPNGDVYRCMSDYNTRQERMFNVKADGWAAHARPQICLHEKCECGCDVDWATKWIRDEKDALIHTIKAQGVYHGHKNDSWWADQTFEKPLAKIAHFIWAPTLICNYNCVYCGCAAGVKNIKREFPSAWPELAVGEWLDAWHAILRRFDYGIVDLSGGEPLLSKATLPVVEAIASKFAVALTTNLSDNSLLTGRIKPGVLREVCGLGNLHIGLHQITASLHPSANNFRLDMFKGRVLSLKNKGFNISVNFVGYPAQMYLADEYKAWCDAHEVQFVMSPWVGIDNDGIASSYSSDEVEYMNRITIPQRQTTTQRVFRSLAHRIVLRIDRISARTGASFRIDGSLENTSSGTWHIVGDDEDLKVGARLYRIGSRARALKEFRGSLCKKELLPGETVDFVVDGELKDLDPGAYELLFDVVLENKFWMADGGAEPTIINVDIADQNSLSAFDIRQLGYEIKIDQSALALVSDRELAVTGYVTNKTPLLLERAQGAAFTQNWSRLERRGKVFKEYRSNTAISDLNPGETVEFRLPVEVVGVTPGSAELIIDVVNEGQYWFANLGVEPFRLRLDIGRRSAATLGGARPRISKTDRWAAPPR